MKPWRTLGLVAIVLLAGTLSAQDSIQKGKIKSADATKSSVTISVDGKDLVLKVTGETRVMDADNKQVENPFRANVFRAGTQVMFKADDQGALIGIRIAGDAKSRDGGDIRRGKIAKLDLGKMLISLKSGDKDVDLHISDKTQVLDAAGADVKEKLQGFKVGAEVYFKAADDYLVAIKLMEEQKKRPALPKVDTSKLVPLNELGAKEYQPGYTGGFYPDGKNERPAAHEAAGLKLAKSVQPLNAEGKVHAEGKIVLLSIGMSNTSQASQGFQKVLAADADKNPRLVFVNGAVGGMTAARIQNPDDNGGGTKYWAEVDQRLKSAGLTREQVQVIWIKQADAGPSQGFPGYAKKLEEELTRIVQVLPKRFPNVKMAYLSSRTYGGYATTGLNPEPYAYESAFSVKWLIERQIKGEPALRFETAKAPWLSWGPYLWANGTTKRPDGFHYEQSDFTSNDGTHLSPAGMEKVGRLMLQFFKTDATTRSWFVQAR